MADRKHGHAWSGWSGWTYNSGSGKDERERRCLDATCGETQSDTRAHQHGQISTFTLNKNRTRICGICGAEVK